MTWQSRVPAVLDALAALWSAVPELAGKVQDGPIPVESPDLEVLSVGHDGTTDGASTDGVILPEGLGGRPDREQFSVSCLISVLNGAGNVAAARGRAFELLGFAAEAVTADRTLGGLVMQAHPENVTLAQIQDQYGALANLTFTVACNAYTRR